MPMTTRQMADAEVLWRRGVSVKRIAQALGLSESCVRNTAYLHRDRFPRRSANGAPRKLDYEMAYMLHARGVSAEAIAERAGVSTRTVTRALMCVALERKRRKQ